MKNLEKLEKEIRLKLPRLIELSEGCLVKDKHGDIEKILHHYESNLVITIDSIGYVSSTKIFTDKDVIIGHEIKLNDVLEWFRLKNTYTKQTSISFTTREGFIRLGISSDDHYLIGDWDLSKNLLKDQSQELIDSLSELIK